MGSPVANMLLGQAGVGVGGGSAEQEALCASLTDPAQRATFGCPPMAATTPPAALAPGEAGAPPTPGDPDMGAPAGPTPGQLPPFPQPVPSQIATQAEVAGPGTLPPAQQQYLGAKQAYDASMAPGGAGGLQAQQAAAPNAIQAMLLRLFGR